MYRRLSVGQAAFDFIVKLGIDLGVKQCLLCSFNKSLVGEILCGNKPRLLISAREKRRIVRNFSVCAVGFPAFVKLIKGAVSAVVIIVVSAFSTVVSSAQTVSDETAAVMSI